MCGNLGGLFVGFLFDRANNVHDSFTGGNALQRRITQSFLLNFMQLVSGPYEVFLCMLRASEQSSMIGFRLCFASSCSHPTAVLLIQKSERLEP